MKSLIVGYLFIGLAIFSSSVYAKDCSIKDISHDGNLLLSAASSLGNVPLAEFLIKEKCVDMWVEFPKDEHPALLASTPEMFNFFSKNGFNYAKNSKNGRNFLTVSLGNSREKDPVFINKELLAEIKRLANKYKVPRSMLAIPTERIDTTPMQIKFVLGVPSSLLLKRDESGNNSLHHAVSMGRGDLAKIIVERQPRTLTRRNQNGLTPLMISAEGCESDSIDEFYKSVKPKSWLQKFPIKDFRYITLSPAQVHLLSDRSDISSYVGASDLEKERVEMSEISAKVPPNFIEALLENIEKSNICKQNAE